jgi:hypothetical protein
MAKADIQRIEVAGSTNIASAGWCSTRFCVDVEFKGGVVYRYHNVSAKVWEDFLAAESKGQFVHSVLKKYECEKLDPEGEAETQEEAEG